MNALLRYDAACKALAEAKAVDEVKDILDKAVALEAYGRQAKNRELEVDAAEIRFRAERRLGQVETELHREGRIHRGGRPPEAEPDKTGSKTEQVSVVRLADLGIDRKLSSRAQKLAAVPQAQFEGLLGDLRERVRDETDRVTRDLLKRGEQAQQREAHAARTVDGCSAFDLLALGASGYRAGAIMADPPWQFMTRSSKGNNRAAANHYGTKSFEDIASLPISKLTADDCVLFLWVMDWDENLEMARAVMSAWGFSHKTTAFTWAKQNPGGEGFHMGQGYWTRANPEACLLATKGEPKRLHADVRQLIVSPVMDHSRKPDEAYKSIERLVGGPYLELYGRRIRPNWTVWGNEIERGQFMRSEVQERAVREAEDAVAAPVTRAVEAIVSRLTPVKIVDEALNRLGGDPKQERIDSARRLRKEGKSIREICAELKASTSTVHAWLDEHGGAEKKRLRDAARHRRKGAA